MDLVLVILVVAAVAAAFLIILKGYGLYWLLVVVAAIPAVYFVTLPTHRRRRVDADGRHRQVGHDGSWTSGRQEDE